MTDREKELYDQINAAFSEALKRDAKITRFMRKADQGNATCEDAWDYSDRIGEIFAEAAEPIILEALNSGTVDEAQEHIAYWPMRNALKDLCYQIVSDYTVRAQEIINQNSGIRIAPQRAEADESRASGVANKVAHSEDESALKRNLRAVKTFTGAVVGDTLEKNVKFLGDSGINAKVKRIAAHGCCEWCEEVAGSYVYPDVPRDIFKRHENCNCSVTYGGKNLKAYKGKSGKENTFRVEEPGKKEEINEAYIADRKSEGFIEFFNEMSTRSGKVTLEKGYNSNSHKDEMKAANIIHNIFGGDVEMLDEKNHQGAKAPDLLWNGKMWEIKGVTSINSIDKRLQDAIHQIDGNPGGAILILDKNSMIEKTEIKETVKRRLLRTAKDKNMDVIIIRGEKIEDIIRKKENEIK